MSTGPVRFYLATPAAPGAIALVVLRGVGAADMVRRLTGCLPETRARRADLGGIDEGLIVALDHDQCWLMPHGGMRVWQRLAQRLTEWGAVPELESSVQARYPEAASLLEAEMLAALSQAASPVAIDWLLDQPRCWRAALENGWPSPEVLSVQGKALNHLIAPPTVVLVGAANVGKSTLTNRLAGRQVSVVADRPGTTRDWVSDQIRLSMSGGQWVVRWIDTPGQRDDPDPIEQQAAALAEQVIASADLRVVMRDAEHPWPHLPGRPPDLKLWNKADQHPPAPSEGEKGVWPVSARTGAGMDVIGAVLAEKLGLSDADRSVPWIFSPALSTAAGESTPQAIRTVAGF